MPALAATVSVSPIVLLPNQPATVLLTMQNNTSSTVTLTGIYPQTGSANAPFAMGQPPLLPGLANTIPSNGSLTVAWNLVPFGNQQLYTGGSPGVTTGIANQATNYNVDTNPADVPGATYSIGALIQTSDGVVTTAVTQKIVMVNNPANLPLQTLNGQFRFDSTLNSDMITLLGV